MKKIIKKSCAVLAALTMIVSGVGIACHTALACDEGTETVLPLWEDDEIDDETVNNTITRR